VRNYPVQQAGRECIGFLLTTLTAEPKVVSHNHELVWIAGSEVQQVQYESEVMLFDMFTPWWERGGQRSENLMRAIKWFQPDGLQALQVSGGRLGKISRHGRQACH
jgi:hypothetical protein